MQRKKILITIDWFLPGTKSGGPVRSYANMIAHLGSDYDFYIITRDTDYCSEEVYTNIKSNTWNQLDAHTSVYYFSKDQLNKANFTKLLNETPFDIAYINGIYSWWFSILPLWLLRKQKNVIVAARGMLNPQAFSVKKTKKKVFITIVKLLNLYKNVKFHATNEDEANHIKTILGKHSKVHVAPNLPRIAETVVVPKKEKSNPTTFVNIARISIEKGTLTMINALHNVKEPLVLDLFGPIYDGAYWELCQRSMERLPNHVKVTYKGILPSEDVPTVLQEYDFFVLLSEGENFGHAILEGFMAGCPVIISDQTPWKDLKNMGIGWDLDLTDKGKISNVFMDAARMSNENYKKLSRAAFEFAKSVTKNPKVLEQNHQMFKSD
ncbi:MAG: glycosyltransferase family 4 protein [Aquaticitalea sp.]